MDADDRNRFNVTGRSDSPPEKVRDLLSDPHVRYLLQHLRGAEGPVDLPTVATHVAAGVTDTPPEEVPSDVRDRVQTFLHHGQLPALERHDVVEYDRETNTVRLVG
jgi:hypothetical protein